MAHGVEAPPGACAQAACLHLVSFPSGFFTLPWAPPREHPEGEAQQHHVRDENGVALARHEGSSREGLVDAHAEHGVGVGHNM